MEQARGTRMGTLDRSALSGQYLKPGEVRTEETLQIPSDVQTFLCSNQMLRFSRPRDVSSCCKPETD
jgi:hypothetical protein